MSSLSYADYLKGDFLKRVEKEDLYAALKKDFDKDILTLLQVTDIKEKWKDIHKNDNLAAPSGMDINNLLAIKAQALVNEKKENRQETAKFDPKVFAQNLFQGLIFYILPPLFVTVVTYFTICVATAILFGYYGYILTPQTLNPVGLDPYYFPYEPFNISSFLLTDMPEIKNFYVIYGSHGMGKSTNFLLAASNISVVKRVVYLDKAPNDPDLYKSFFIHAPFVKTFGLDKLIDTLPYLYSADFDTFVKQVRKNGVPVLIIDQINSAKNIDALIERAKFYTDRSLIRVVFICSTGNRLHDFSSNSGSSRALFKFYENSPASVGLQLLAKRNFSDFNATSVINIISSLSHLVQLTPNNWELAVQEQVEWMKDNIIKCFDPSLKLNFSHMVDLVKSEVSLKCCTNLHKCLLDKNVFMYKHHGNSLYYESKLAEYVVNNST